MSSHRCTRRIEFDAAHRVMRHESKCKHLHGHRYVLDVTCEADKLDDIGRVIDFSVVKTVFGAWVDENLDHGVLLNVADRELHSYLSGSGHKTYTMEGNPTAENIAQLAYKVANQHLASHGVRVVHIRCYETPNCWADWGSA